MDITTELLRPPARSAAASARPRSAETTFGSAPLHMLSDQLQELDGELSRQWREALAVGDPVLGDVLAETVRHVRHARLALLRQGIG